LAGDVNAGRIDEVSVKKGNTIEVFGPEHVPPGPAPSRKRKLTNRNAHEGFFP
jgi:hypothetical protein